MTLLSRVFGFARDVIVAHQFGAGMATDAFFVAFKIPNFLRRLFAEGGFSQAFVPVLAEYKEQNTFAELQEFVNCTISALGLVVFIISFIGILAAPLVILVFAPGFLDEPDKYDLAVQMLRITFPYILFISLTALAGGLLNTYGKFAVPAFTPVLLNISLIFATFWIAPRLENPIVGLAWGVCIAGIIQLSFQIPFILRLGFVPRFAWNIHHQGVQKIRKLMLPAIFGASVTQVNLLIDTLIASFLVSGSVSWLYYSDRLIEFPLGVLGIAMATTILPTLSKKHMASSPIQFSKTLDHGLRWSFIVCVPAAVAMFVLSAPMLITLFQYGAFSAKDALMATLSLRAYAVGLMAFILVKILATGYYARQDTRTPVRVGIIAVVCNTAMNLILFVPLAHAGLALATSLAAFINAGLLLRGLLKSKVYSPEARWLWLFAKVLIATSVMGTALWWQMGDVEIWLQWTLYQRAWHLLLLLLTGVATYFSTLFLLGFRANVNL